MSLSPIQIFQQQQNPLAQILAGGNETITGIFDKAIQIGRDMSNKQLQQEQDMMSMRNAETNMAQRRAENLQQNNEDAIKFARGAFESDRKFGVDQTQQAFQNERVTAQDLFSNQQSTERMGLAERGLNLQTDKFEADKAQAEQTRLDVLDSRQQAKDSYTNLVTGGSGKYTDPASGSEAQGLYSAAEKAGDSAGMSHFGKSVDTLKTKTTGASKSPEALELERLRLEEARRKDVNAGVDDIVDNNPSSFPGPASKYEEELRTFAASKSKPPEEALYLPEFDSVKREAIISAQREQKVIERNAVNQASTEDAYVALLPGATEAQKENRRLLYRKAKRLEASAPTTSGAPASAEAPNPAKGYFATKRAPLQP